MNPSQHSETGLRKIIVLRIFIVSLILIFGALVYYIGDSQKEAFSLIVILSIFYLFNLLYLLFESFFKYYREFFKYLIVFSDIILSSFIIYFTDGRSSPFIFLFPLILLFSGMLISRTASYFSLILCIFLYLFIIILHFKTENNIITVNELFSSELFTEKSNLMPISFHLIGFVLIAILGGYLSEKIRVAGERLGISEESLIILQNLHENILQSLTSGVVTLDLEEKIISINQWALNIFEIDNQENAIGQDFKEFVNDLHISEMVDKKRDQINFYTPGGKQLILGLSASLLKDDENKTVGYTVIFQDLTEIRNLEEKLRSSEKMAFLGQLAGGLAHELRNPLSAISGAVEILSSEAEQSEISYRLSRVASREIERLNLIVEDFLLLTSPVNVTNSKLVDLGQIIKDTINSFKNTVKRDDLLIEINIENGILVEADSYRLKQVFWNLLDNSMDSMPGGGKIEIKCSIEKGIVNLSFSDEGEGIKDEDLTKIFDPFFTTKEIGTGLGLAIVQKVVEGYNGNISIYSSIGKGTRIVLSLPEPLN
jgi:two-component system sensor histidine kinase PilS (NtrC family)